MGYAGGSSPDPDYGHIGDHTETVQVDYDPARITYKELLAIFWQSHDPTHRTWSRQYRHVVFYQDDTQRRLAEKSKAALEQTLDKTVRTEIAPLQSFTWAEEYHQKYLLKSERALVQELQRIYPRPRDFDNSTAVARLNGYVAGDGTRQRLAREIDQLGLSARGRDLLMGLMRP